MRSPCSVIVLYFSLPVSLGLATQPRRGSLSLAMTNRRRNVPHHNDASWRPQATGSSGPSSKMETSTLLAADNAASDPSSPRGLLKWLSPRRLSVSIILLSAFLNLLGFTMAGKVDKFVFIGCSPRRLQ